MGTRLQFTIPNAAGTAAAIQVYYNVGNWKLYRTPSAGSGVVVVASTFAAGDYVTRSSLRGHQPRSHLSINGSAFTSVSSNVGAATLGTVADIGRYSPGTGPVSEPINGDILWTASGTGTLSNANATTLNGYGNADPTLTGISFGTPDSAWAANSSAYQSSTTSYATTNTYDAADQLSTEADPAGKSYSFYYDNRGNLRGTQYPNGTGGIDTYSWTESTPTAGHSTPSTATEPSPPRQPPHQPISARSPTTPTPTPPTARNSPNN